MGVFEDVHRDRVTGCLAMFDRMIFKGRLTALYKENGAKCFLWSQGVALTDFTPYAKWTTARIADTVRGLAEAAGRPVISFDHVKTRNFAQTPPPTTATTRRSRPPTTASWRPSPSPASSPGAPITRCAPSTPTSSTPCPEQHQRSQPASTVGTAHHTHQGLAVVSSLHRRARQHSCWTASKH